MATKRKSKVIDFPKAEYPDNLVKRLTKSELQRLRGVLYPMQTLQAQVQQLTTQYQAAKEVLDEAVAEYMEVYTEFGLDPETIYNISQEGDVTTQE